MIHVGRHTFFRSLVLAVAYELNIKGAQARLIGAGTDFRVPLILNLGETGGFGHLLRSDQGSADAQVRDVDHENL